jgi:hypothetical protein
LEEDVEFLDVLSYLSESESILTVIGDSRRIPIVLDGILYVVQIMFDHCCISLVSVQSSEFIFTILQNVGYIRLFMGEILIRGKKRYYRGEIRI